MTRSIAPCLIILLAGLLAGPGEAWAAASEDGHGASATAAAPAGEHGDAGEDKASKESDEKADGEEPPPPPLWPETAAVEMEKQPFILVRGLRKVQDEIAAGSTSAHAQQRQLLRDLGEQMRGLPVAVWDDVRNVRAAVFFALSGGNPAILKVVLGHTKTPLVPRRLIRSALAYGEGRFVDALSLMHKIDARTLDPSLGGMVALIQGTLIAKKEPQKAVPYFDLARLLAAGTLIEESALRLQILLLARDGQVERFDILASQYSRRFPKSLFARNFRQQFFSGVARQNFKRASEWISRTESELMKVPTSERAGLYLAIAQEAIKGGNTDIARFAAGKARELITEGSRASQRAKLYEGAALAVSPDFEKGRALLDDVDLAKLNASDRQLRDAALSVGRSVGKWPDDGNAPEEEPPAAVGRAQALLGTVDSLLGGQQ